MNSYNYRAYYFIGIGGIGMSAIARYFKALGKQVAGYDRTETELTKQLVAEGIVVHYTDDITSISSEFMSIEDTLVVITPAVPQHHSELNYFKANGFTILKRAAVLGYLTDSVKGIAVAGTHGKTTVSSMIGHVLHQSHVKASAILGGIATNYQSNLLLPEADNQYTVVEADEFDRSLLQLHPYMAVLTAIDADHLDIYSDLEDLRATFGQFVTQIQEHGILLIKAGLQIDISTETQEYIDVFTYSVKDEADFKAVNITNEGAFYTFDLHTPVGVIRAIKLGVPGLVNVENAVAAASIAWLAGATEHELRSHLASFKGIKRRFEYHINQANGVYIDDYAHHPAELEAVISSVKSIYPTRKITGIFQPHLFSRTRDFAPGFAASLDMLDEVILLDIYPAREEPMPGVSSHIIFDKIENKHKILITKEALNDTLAERDLDIVLTLGAGDIDKYVQPTKKQLLLKWKNKISEATV